MINTPRLKICLAASGGGHLRQLLDMEPAWSGYDHFFVTENTALGRSLGATHPVEFVAHFAFGQGRLGRPFTMIKAGLKNLVQSFRIIHHAKPDVIVTTGAGSVFFIVLFGKLLRSRVIVIESFARFSSPSMFSRMTMRLANKRVVQSANLLTYWKDAEVFDPLRILEASATNKEPLIFGTVGATLPFDRLTTMLSETHRSREDGKRLVLQVGEGGLHPGNTEAYDTLTLDEMKTYMQKADIVVCHGGTGSLITALRAGCKVIAVPREPALGEHYDDHQREITSAFQERGLIAVVNDPRQLAEAIDEAARKPRVFATTDASELNNFLLGTFSGWTKKTLGTRAPA